MRFTEFLTEFDDFDPDKELKSQKRYFDPAEVLTKSQWLAVSSDLDFHSYVQHPGQAGTILVCPDERYSNTYKILSTANLKYAVEYQVSKKGKIFKKTVYEKNSSDGHPTWDIIKTKSY